MKSILAACLILALAPASYADDLADQVLAVHNQERAEVGVPPVVGGQGLANDAQRWADHLASTGKFEHAGSDENPSSGENLSMGTEGLYTPAALSQL